ncbi:hypothetical protein RB195_003086 [Necator americanus]|uniref:Protein-tyrosine phosphatase n=1 Tax=Necator americanus TaxID=51031 RepID=A0ABR1DLZ5_NECAM
MENFQRTCGCGNFDPTSEAGTKLQHSILGRTVGTAKCSSSSYAQGPLVDPKLRSRDEVRIYEAVMAFVKYNHLSATQGSDVHLVADNFIGRQNQLDSMFRGSRKKFGRSPSLRTQRSQKSSKSVTQSLIEDETVIDKREDSKIEMTMKSTREPKTASKEKLLVYRFVRRTMEKGVQGLRTEFLSMKRSNNLALMRKFVQMNPQGKNRYKDVGCLDATRVKLMNCCDDDYIHANYVATPTCSRRFICTQAPLEKTSKDFWLMCIQDRVEFIVMLCNFFEKGARKCFQYFPTSGSLQFDDITITFVKSTMVRFVCSTNAHVRISAFLVERHGKRMKVKHVHWVDWPDRGVPPADTAIVQILDIIKSTQTPIVVHCSAGVGRTGSIVMIQYILESLSLNQPIEESDKILLKLRSQRANTIQTDQQYLFVHQVLLNYFQENQLLDAAWKPYLDNFTRLYNKFVF